MQIKVELSCPRPKRGIVNNNSSVIFIRLGSFRMAHNVIIYKTALMNKIREQIQPKK